MTDPYDPSTVDDGYGYDPTDYADAPDSSIAPLGALTQAASGYSPEATAAAKGVLSQGQAYTAEGFGDYTSAQKQQQTRANAVREALRAARAQLAAEKPDTGAMWMAVGSALGAPTRTGTLSESLSAGAGAGAEYKQRAELEKRAREKELRDYDLQTAQYGTEPDAIDEDLLKSRLGLAQAKIGLGGQETRYALNTLARTGRPASTAGEPPIAKLQTYLKTLPPGSPEARQVTAAIQKMTAPVHDPNAPITLTPADHAMAEQIAAWKRRPYPPTGRNDRNNAIMAEAYTINPAYDEVQWDRIKQVEQQYADERPTAPGGQIRAFNTAISHASVVRDLAVALKNGDNQAANQLYQKVGALFGGSAPTSFEAAVKLVAPEITNAVQASNSTGAERDSAAQIMGVRNSPKQAADILDKAVLPLLSGKLGELRRGYYSNIPDTAVHLKNKFETKLSPEAIRMMRKYKIEGFEDAPAPSAPGAPKLPNKTGKTAADYRREAGLPT